MKLLTCLSVVVSCDPLVLDIIKTMDMSVHFWKVPIFGASLLSCLLVISL